MAERPFFRKVFQMTRHHDQLTTPRNYDEWVKQGRVFNPALLSFMVYSYQKKQWVGVAQ